jgi:DNA repair exonuclease SbcCD ATPase subunit
MADATERMMEARRMMLQAERMMKEAKDTTEEARKWMSTVQRSYESRLGNIEKANKILTGVITEVQQSLLVLCGMLNSLPRSNDATIKLLDAKLSELQGSLQLLHNKTDAKITDFEQLYGTIESRLNDLRSDSEVRTAREQSLINTIRQHVSLNLQVQNEFGVKTAHLGPNDVYGHLAAFVSIVGMELNMKTKGLNQLRNSIKSIQKRVGQTIPYAYGASVHHQHQYKAGDRDWDWEPGLSQVPPASLGFLPTQRDQLRAGDVNSLEQ